ncbi:(2Fe-2S) ferredoxin domain-containing protein [Kamptonema formosum]|uniref:(2Fe-2S) ferredoxin domain-containing protein n=1 Tax=Kamptonema formosum TaxID=331992 RepID=UPI0003491817|nr:(2Fe-2S) ferredoxin domain-containing protein [Oscillatoria sp. PCC 10802]
MKLANLDERAKFRVEGQFLGFTGSPEGKLKYIVVAAGESEWRIKLPKQSREAMGQSLVPGDWIEVFGEKKLKGDTGKLKLKASQVSKVAAVSQQTEPAAEVWESQPKAQPKAKILVCQKSGCVKRGGKTLCQALETALCERGLQNHVAIERTGCLKGCSSGPNCVLMPSKTRLSPAQPEAIAALLEKHLGCRSSHTTNRISLDGSNEIMAF